jgi:phosphopantothenoylcysteine synthetase/decarboxylase
MNGKMWMHAATQRNIARLEQDGCQFIGPEKEGMLACGYSGPGRLMEQSKVVVAAEKLLHTSSKPPR